MTAAVVSRGHFNTADETWKVYQKREDVIAISQSYSIPEESWSSAAEERSGTEWNRLFEGMLGAGGEGCITWTATESDVCSSTGTGTNNFYLLDGEERGELFSTYQIDRSDISGTPVPDADPPQNYPACTYKDTTVFTLHMDTPPTVTTTYEIGGSITTVYSRTSGGVTESEEWLDGKTYQEWIDSTKETLWGEMTWPRDACLDGDGCNSLLAVAPAIEPEETGVEIEMELRKARFRVGVPEGFSTEEAPRSVYEVQWDLVFFPEGHDATIDDPEITPPDPLPEGWEHPQIPDPDAPDPSLVESQSWTWGGDMENPWSDYFEIPLPEGPGETRRVNLLVICYHSSRLGVKPTAHGEQWTAPA